MGSSNPCYSSPSSSIMEPGSISLTDSGPPSPTTAASSSSPLHHGLNFGRKIYFEDHAAVPPSSHPPPTKPVRASPSSTSSSTKKGRGAVGSGGPVQGGQPPRCQVEGCKVDLSDAKAYYSRHKVCGMHSKSPKVIVGGIEQRFCQQCSRFHQLAEFDQVKRSCRRRLAGHNERRRKPPPGSLLASRCGRLSSSVFENSSRSGGFVMDFTAYPRHLGRGVWSPPRLSDRGVTNQMPDHGRFPIHHPWQQSCSGNAPPPNVFLQGSTGGGCGSFSSPGIPPGECYTGVAADSTCALSLLSNQPWSSSRSQAPALSINEMLTQQEPTTAAPHGASTDHIPGASWGFKANDDSGGIPSDLGLGQFSQPLDSHFSGELELSQQSRRQYVELDHTRAFDSSQQMHWSH